MKNRLSRRRFLKQTSLATGAAATLPLLPFWMYGSAAQSPATAFTPGPLTLDASSNPPAAQAGGFHMGTSVAPGGHTLTLDSRSLLRDGRPWMLISGEFQSSRCPAAEWRDELLKVKAGGVSIVTTYIFWIHHEEVQGVWDWTGQRDLHQFLITCQQVGLNVLLRVGPWCHGEVRNGGFPNWLQKMGDDNLMKLRSDDPGYLAHVAELYAQIAQQSHGLLWKDGGPIVAIQLENEFSGPAKHLLTLKQMARDAGMDVPLYTCTGWGAGSAPSYGEIVPFAGAYAEGFWDRSLERMPAGYTRVFRFSRARRGSAATMGALGATPAGTMDTPPPPAGSYPSFTCELGGGMMASYHRRILIYPEDAESIGLVSLGSGVNLLGFYMYHGGQNPEGKLTYLNETQATAYWNDLPVKNYDFQAPIGEYGQEREHYRWLRQIGLFLADFGPGLSAMSSRTPAIGGPLNWAVRSDGSSGYVFVSHYQRLSPQPACENVQFQIKLAGRDVTVPSQPVTIPDNSRFFWPLNLDLGGVKLVSASAQPICQIEDRATLFTVFKQTAAVPAEFVFDASTATLDSTIGKAATTSAQIHIDTLQPGLGEAIRLHAKDGKRHVILLLDETTSLNLSKGEWQGRQHLFLTRATLLLDGHALRLRTEDPANASVAIFPAPASLTEGHSAVPAKDEGLFRRFSPRPASTAPLRAVIEPVQPAGSPRTIPIAPSVTSRKQGMAMQPEDADFAQAAVWRVKLPAGIAPSRDVRLRVHYTGDVLRAYHGDKLLDDDFYNTRPFEIGLRRYGPAVYQDGIVLKILPLREDAPIYITDRGQLKFNDAHIALSLDAVDIIETREVTLLAAM